MGLEESRAWRMASFPGNRLFKADRRHRAMGVSLLISMHEFEWLLSQAVADRYGHDAENHDRLLNGVKLVGPKADRREHPQPACCGPTFSVM